MGKGLSQLWILTGNRVAVDISASFCRNSYAFLIKEKSIDPWLFTQVLNYEHLLNSSKEFQQPQTTEKY